MPTNTIILNGSVTSSSGSLAIQQQEGMLAATGMVSRAGVRGGCYALALPDRINGEPQSQLIGRVGVCLTRSSDVNSGRITP